MSWLDRIIPSRINTEKRTKSVPEGLWSKCPACDSVLYRAELERNYYVCPKCDHHHRINAVERLEQFLDQGTAQVLFDKYESLDPLKFKDSKRYRDRLSQAQKKTNKKSAMIVREGTIETLPVVASCFNFEFMGGSMGSVVGEKFALAAEHALAEKKPYICFAASGGARMQEALFSLMQMAKTSAAIARLKEAGIPYVSVLTDPTTGGVSASLAIKQTVGQDLPEGFQRSEFLLEHGMLDQIVDRRDLSARIAKLLRMLYYKDVIVESESSV